MIVAETIQKTELHQEGGVYSRQHFINLINQMSPEQYNEFAKECLHLCEFYARTVGCYATDVAVLYILNEQLMWEIEQIDFTMPVTFRKLSEE